MNTDNMEEAGFDDDDVGFISGNFADLIGVDFFGFKELGLSAGTVPTFIII